MGSAVSPVHFSQEKWILVNVLSSTVSGWVWGVFMLSGMAVVIWEQPNIRKKNDFSTAVAKTPMALIPDGLS